LCYYFKMIFISAILGLLTAPSPLLGRDYFIAPSQPSQAVNQLKLVPGDRVFFAGGCTFSAGIVIKDSGAPGRPITLGSYGKGRALIAPSSPAENGLLLKNASYIDVRNLAFAGPGREASRADGILLLNDSSKPCLQVRVQQCEASGFGPSGMEIKAQGRYGWRDVSIQDCSFHHNHDLGLHSSADWLQTPRPHQRFSVRQCKAFSNWGAFDSKENQGGIVLMGVSGATVEYCEAYDNGGDYPYGQGVFGVWCWSADHVLMQFNVSHHNRQNGKGSDGGGFDLDGATTDSVVQYNYSHDNDGAGVLLAQFGGAYQSGPFRDNIVRFNLSERDAQRGEYGGITVWGASFNDKIERTEIYNNSVYAFPAKRGGKSSALRFMDLNYRKLDFHENLFYAAGVPLIDLPQGGDRDSLRFRHNDYFSAGPFKVIWDGKPFATLGSWAGTGLARPEMENGRMTALQLDPALQKAGWEIGAKAGRSRRAP
jgi:hypothetical protein